MKRRDKKDASDLPWWIKLGGGTFRMTDHEGKRRIIKRDQKFQASPEDIPEGFRDVVKPLDGRPLLKKGEVPGPAPEDVAGGDYTIKRRSPNSPWYDVFDANGKKVNEKAQKHDQALELVKSLQ